MKQNKKPNPIEPESPIKTFGNFFIIPVLKIKKINMKIIKGAISLI